VGLCVVRRWGSVPFPVLSLSPLVSVSLPLSSLLSLSPLISVSLPLFFLGLVEVAFSAAFGPFCVFAWCVYYRSF
jgi:hypothetical protein